MKSALGCKPAVFVIGDQYEILVYCKSKSLVSVRVGNVDYYVRNSGVLSTQKRFARIRVPQSALDKAGEYTVVTEKTVRRTTNDPALQPAQCESFKFYPVPQDNIKIYHTADVHGKFELALACVKYFAGGADLYVVNGDMGEVMTERDYIDTIVFLGKLAGGEKPIVFTRGNHDTRGAMAEDFAEYFPSDNGNFYYAYSVGPISGVVFDCGEDKLDNHIEYGGDGVKRGVNIFEDYRRRETEYLAAIAPIKNKIALAIGHINPSQLTLEKGSCFDIERELYTEWTEIFERKGIQCMLCGHMHRAYVLSPNDERSLLPHGYPVVVGSQCDKESLWGTAIVISGDKMSVRFTDNKGVAGDEIVLKLDRK